MRLLLGLIMSLAVGAVLLVVLMDKSKQQAFVDPSPTKAVPKQAPTIIRAKTGEAVQLPAESSLTETKGYLYRWRDADGTIHFQSAPPDPELQTTKIPYDKQKIEPLPPTVRDNTPAQDASPRYDQTSNPLSVYTPEGINQLLDQVDETAARLKQRNQELDRLRQDL